MKNLLILAVLSTSLFSLNSMAGLSASSKKGVASCVGRAVLLTLAPKVNKTLVVTTKAHFDYTYEDYPEAPRTSQKPLSTAQLNYTSTVESLLNSRNLESRPNIEIIEETWSEAHFTMVIKADGIDKYTATASLQDLKRFYDIDSGKINHVDCELKDVKVYSAKTKGLVLDIK